MFQQLTDHLADEVGFEHPTSFLNETDDDYRSVSRSAAPLTMTPAPAGRNHESEAA